jgi:hypothetical protein
LDAELAKKPAPVEAIQATTMGENQPFSAESTHQIVTVSDDSAHAHA